MFDSMCTSDSDDVILWLLPHKGEGFDGAAFATAKPENASRFVAARREELNQRDDFRGEREDTEPPEEYGHAQNTDSLVVRWSQGARTSVGVVGGCAANADLCFQKIPGISRYHFAITFDDRNRPIVRDLGSTCGTKVTYDGEKRQRVSSFDWPLDGPSIANGNSVILNVTDSVQFKVILPDHDYTSPEHVEKVKRFRMGRADPTDLFASTIIQSGQGTRFPSGHRTPSEGSRARPILYKKSLGKGSFGSVTYVWDLSTREQYVVKQPLDKHVRSSTYNEEDWRREAKIMESVKHVSICSS